MDPLPIQIRHATAGDHDRLAEIYRQASLSNEGDRTALLAHPETLVWSAPPEAAGLVRVAVTDEGAIAGFATTLYCDERAELEDLFVDPELVRRGVGMRLVRDAAEGARDAGYVELEVTANPAASEFYSTAGFTGAGTAATRFGPASRLRLTIARTESDRSR